MSTSSSLLRSAAGIAPKTRKSCSPGRAYSDPNYEARSVIVELTLAWLNRCRELARDREKLNRTALAFLILATIHVMLR
jgi:hypothetical protein